MAKLSKLQIERLLALLRPTGDPDLDRMTEIIVKRKIKEEVRP